MQDLNIKKWVTQQRTIALQSERFEATTKMAHGCQTPGLWNQHERAVLERVNDVSSVLWVCDVRAAQEGLQDTVWASAPVFGLLSHGVITTTLEWLGGSNAGKAFGFEADFKVTAHTEEVICKTGPSLLRLVEFLFKLSE